MHTSRPQRSESKALVLALSVSLLLAMGTGCSQEAQKARHLERANKHAAAGAYDSAEVEYYNVLRIEPSNQEALLALSSLWLEQGRFGHAIQGLLRARELDAENVDVRLKLAEATRSVGLWSDARDQAAFVLEHRPTDPIATIILAEASFQPEDIAATTAKIEAAYAAESATPAFHVARGILALRQRQWDEAEASFRQAIALDPEFAVAFEQLGNVYRARNDAAQAEENLKTAAQLSPVRARARMAYVQFKIQQGDIAGGRALLEEINQAAPDFIPAIRWLAELAFNEKNLDEAAALTEKILMRDPVNPEALLITARIEMARGESAKAVTTLEKIVQLYPQAAPAHFHLAQAHLAAKDNTRAIAELNQALALAPDYPEAILQLAGLNISGGDVAAAITSLKALLEQRPRLRPAQLLLVEAYGRQQNLAEMTAVLRDLIAQTPRDTGLRLTLADALVRQGQSEEARQSLVAALEINPDLAPAIERLVDIDLTAGNSSDAVERVAQLQQRQPQSASSHLLFAKIHLAQRDFGRAEEDLKKAIELQPDSQVAYGLLARVYVTTNRRDEALANLRQVVSRNPKDVAAFMTIATLSEQNGDFASARDAYEKILQANEKFVPALNNLAYLYSEHFDQVERAHELARSARTLAPYEAPVADTLGWILYKRRDFRAALSLLEESAAKLSDNAEAQHHLGMVHYMLGNEDPARTALQQAVNSGTAFPERDDAIQRLEILSLDPQNPGTAARSTLEAHLARVPNDPAALQRLGAILEQEGDAARAVEAYQKALEFSPENVRLLVSLARAQTARGETTRALELAKKARDLAPNDAGIAHIVGRLAFLSGDFTWSASVLQEAARRMPESSELQLDWARTAYSVGRIAEAETALQRVVQNGAPSASSGEARQFLELLALAENPAAAAAAKGATDEILRATSTNVPALMASARANEHLGNPTEAMRTYEQVLNRYPEFSPAKKRLALLFAQSDTRQAKALEIANAARTAFPNDLEVAQALGIIAFLEGNFSRAATLLAESTGRGSADARSLFYLGMAHHRLKKPAEARPALEEAIRLGLPETLAAQAREVLAEQ